MADLNELIAKIALAAIEESKPSSILFGEVLNINPLTILIDQKLLLTEDFLYLTNNVRDHDVEMTVNHQTESISLNANHSHFATFEGNVDTEVTNKVNPNSTKVESTATSIVSGSVTVDQVYIPLDHFHSYRGKKIFKVHYGLKKGEKVILLRVQGGQKFIVLDRVVN